MASSQPPVILVLAGVNGAGKSSVMGASLRSQDLAFFNPDIAARRVREKTGCSIEDANSIAWNECKRRLEDAIRHRTNFAFESTLGGNTIPALLADAASSGFEVLIWFVGLATPDQHVARVRKRVANGGHDIPEEKIRERWLSSRRNLIALLPLISELRLFDNSAEGDPARGTIPDPVLLLHWQEGRIVAPSIDVLSRTPEWAKPIVARAMQLHGSAR